MTVLYIRAHKRFAVRRMVRITGTAGDIASGLLIELSLQGCRISNLGRTAFEIGQRVALEIDGYEPVSGAVRWAHDGLAGLRFDRSLHAGTLDRMIHSCRDKDLSGQAHRSARA
ncbi:MAG: PilZ domain-containing protein [Novosphingobium sp.]|nr:PilZ domain-containing protein [Novosphingobium sp.]